MRLHLIALSAAFAANAIAAPSTDSLHSAECASALHALQDVEDAMLASTKSSQGNGAADRPVLSKLAKLKRDAARTCLGGDGSVSRPHQHLGQTPLSVTPVTATPLLPLPLPSPRLPARTPSPLQPVLVPPLKSVVSCDAVGCWINDGTRLQKLGPGLLGPKGFCSVQGSVLSCP